MICAIATSLLAFSLPVCAIAAEKTIPPLSLDQGVQAAFEISLDIVRHDQIARLRREPNQEQVAIACLGVSGTGIKPDKPKGILRLDWWTEPDKLQDSDLLTARKEWTPEPNVRIVLMPISECETNRDKLVNDLRRPYWAFVGTQSALEGFRQYPRLSTVRSTPSEDDGVENDVQYFGILRADVLGDYYFWLGLDDGKPVIRSDLFLSM
jgi:hypothetical protein